MNRTFEPTTAVASEMLASFAESLEGVPNVQALVVVSIEGQPLVMAASASEAASVNELLDLAKFNFMAARLEDSGR